MSNATRFRRPDWRLPILLAAMSLLAGGCIAERKTTAAASDVVDDGSYVAPTSIAASLRQAKAGGGVANNHVAARPID